MLGASQDCCICCNKNSNISPHRKRNNPCAEKGLARACRIFHYLNGAKGGSFGHVHGGGEVSAQAWRPWGSISKALLLLLLRIQSRRVILASERAFTREGQAQHHCGSQHHHPHLVVVVFVMFRHHVMCLFGLQRVGSSAGKPLCTWG